MANEESEVNCAMLKQFNKLSIPIRIMGCLLIPIGLLIGITMLFLFLARSYFSAIFSGVDIYLDDSPSAAQAIKTKTPLKKPFTHSTTASKFENSHEKCIHKCFALLVFSLLLIGLPCVMCFLWVRKEQWQYALNRQLIEALKRSDTKQALWLVNAGADPNTLYAPSPSPTLQDIWNSLFHRDQKPVGTGATAFLIACGRGVDSPNGLPPINWISPLDPRLIQTMLFHGANVNAKDNDGWKALRMTVIRVLYDSPADYKTDKEIIQHLLVYGADPDEENNAYAGFYGTTPMKTAGDATSTGESPHPDLVALLRKYSKHP